MLTALGIHIYAGGFTLGVREHFNVLAHFENSDFGRETIRRNFPDLPVFSRVDQWPVEKLKGVDFIYGNPPCRFWSNASNKRGESVADRFDRLQPTDHKEFLDVCLQLRPLIFVFESVPGILTQGKEFLKSVQERCAAAGYATTRVLINTRFLGLPQNRRRVFLVMHQVELKPLFVKVEAPTVNQVLAAVTDREPVRLNENQAKLLPQLGYGDRIRELFLQTYPEGTKGRPNVFRRRLDGDGISPTIATNPDYIHPTENRLLNPAEAAALCGYPLDYKFVGSQSDRFHQIGAAVLPAAGEFIASLARVALEEGKPLTSHDLQIFDFS